MINNLPGKVNDSDDKFSIRNQFSDRPERLHYTGGYDTINLSQNAAVKTADSCEFGG